MRKRIYAKSRGTVVHAASKEYGYYYGDNWIPLEYNVPQEDTGDGAVFAELCVKDS